MSSGNTDNEAHSAADLSPEEARYHEKLLQDVGMRVFAEFLKYRDNPRLMVLVGHGALELMVNTIVDAKLKHGKAITSDGRGYPHSARLLVLNEAGILSDKWYAVLSWLRKIRNRAVHEPLFRLTRADLGNLDEEWRDPDRFPEVLVKVVMGFWNDHLEILRPVLTPTLEENAQCNRGGTTRSGGTGRA